MSSAFMFEVFMPRSSRTILRPFWRSIRHCHLLHLPSPDCIPHDWLCTTWPHVHLLGIQSIVCVGLVKTTLIEYPTDGVCCWWVFELCNFVCIRNMSTNFSAIQYPSRSAPYSRRALAYNVGVDCLGHCSKLFIRQSLRTHSADRYNH